MSNREALEKTIRKYRKKLRQIENLERLDRDLTDEEIEKALKKDILRQQLQELLQIATPEESQDEDADDDGNEADYDDEDTTFDVTYEDDEEDDDSNNSSNFVHVKKEEVADARHDAQKSKEVAMATDSNVSKTSTSQTSPAQPSVKEASPKQPLEEVAGSRGDEKPRKKHKVEASQVKAKAGVKGQGQQRSRPLRFDVSFLEGHSDLVCCVAMDEDHLVSAGRDTAIKVWSVASKSEIRSLGGHSGTVSALILLNEEMSSQFSTELELGTDDQMIISASQDCSLKFWSLNSGHLLKSIYTFNPINCMAYVPEEKLLITGMGGGKISAWDILSGTDVSSILPSSEPVTALEYDGDSIYSASGDGFVRVLKLRDRELHLMYVSETVRTKDGDLWEAFKPIRGMSVMKGLVYFGDEGCNIKVLNWKQGVMHKLRNHMTEFGSTDSICFHGDWNLASGYDIDRGLGFINIRNLQENYLGTLDDDDTGLIMCLACAENSKKNVVMATGGADLKLWTQTDVLGDTTVEVKRLSKYEQPNSDSEMDSESEVSDSEVGQGVFQRFRLRRNQSQEDDPSNNGWFSWCSIV